MSTTDAVVERALALADEQGDRDEAVDELLRTALGKRVALVMARQRISDESSELGERAARAVSLLNDAIASEDVTD